MFPIAVVLALVFSAFTENPYSQKNNRLLTGYYAENLGDTETTPFYFWSLVKLFEDNPEAEKDFLLSHLQFEEKASGNTAVCLLEAFFLFQDKSDSDNKVDRLIHAYQCTDNADYLIVALYEVAASSRLAWYEQHTGLFYSAQFSPAQTALISKALGQEYNRYDLFTTRRFRLSDVYIFDGYVHDGSVDISGYFDQLRNQIQSASRVHPLVANLVGTTIITGLFRLNEYDAIVREYLDRPDLSFIPDSRYKLNTFRRVSYAAQFSGYYQTNLSLYRDHLVPLTRLIGDHQDWLIVQYEFGNSLYMLDNFAGALEAWEIVYDDSVGIRDSRYQSPLLNNLAVLYLKTGNFSQYIELQINALRKAEEVNDYINQLFILNNLYIYHRRNNNWETAFSYLNQALELSSEIQKPEEIATVLRSFGTYYREVENDYDKALQYFHQAAAMADSIGSNFIIQTVNSEIALTFQLMGRYNDAMKIYSDMASQAISRDDPSSYFDFTIEIANILIKTGRHEEAHEQITTIRSFNMLDVDFNTQVRASNVLARYEIQMENVDRSLDYLSGYAAQILERTRNSADFQSGYLRMDPEFQQTFRILTDILLFKNRPEEAVTWLDEIKNISKASFYNNSLLKSNILNEEELLRDFVLGNRIERLRNELITASASERVSLNTQLTEAINERNRLKYKVMRNAGVEEKLNLPRLQRLLGRNELIISFSLFENNLYKASISAGTIDIEKISFTDADIERIGNLIEGLANNNTDLRELHWLYTRLFSQPLHARYNKLYVVPDGFLYRIPLETLPVEPVASSFSFGSARYMVENYSISYLNSIMDLDGHSRRVAPTRNARDFAGFGVSSFSRPVLTPYGIRQLSPLPFAEVEVESIRGVLTNMSDVTVKTGFESTERKFRQYAGDSRILHIASHSEVFHNDPLFSLIYLKPSDYDAGDSNNDGLIYAYELFELNLNNELVMLSSCESGSGSYIQGSGITGLSRAFTYAGAHSLVMNLWQIRDQTASEIAVSFYTYLNRGLNKDQALQRAKLDYINNNNSDPYLWGSFVIYGDIRPLVHKKRYFTYMITGLLLVVMFRFTIQAVHLEE